MKFLIDNALPLRLADLLPAAGHDAVHVRNDAMHAAADDEIQQRALIEDRIIVSDDSDLEIYANLAAAAGESPIFQSSISSPKNRTDSTVI